MNGFKVLASRVLDHGELAFDGGIMAGHVEPSESGNGLVDQSAHIAFIADIGTDEFCVRIEGSQLADQGSPLVVMPARHHDLRALLGERQGRGASDACQGSGNEYYGTVHDGAPKFPSILIGSLKCHYSQ